MPANLGWWQRPEFDMVWDGFRMPPAQTKLEKHAIIQRCPLVDPIIEPKPSAGHAAMGWIRFGGAGTDE